MEKKSTLKTNEWFRGFKISEHQLDQESGPKTRGIG